MLTLNDGRNELWQWDTGRTLTVDADCSQVHFSNKVFGRSIDVDVIDGVSIIPDILLQTDKDLNAWAFVGTAENGYTKISKTFKVNRRNKPAYYVFTPPDQTSLEEIKEKIDYLESIQDPDAIKNAVDDYLANNPIMVKETDPTVFDWAKRELFNKADLPTSTQSFVTVDGIEYYRYHAGATYGFTWYNPSPLPGAVTITARGVAQYGGTNGTRLKTIYSDGTYGPDLYIVASGESRTVTVTTDTSKTLAKITGNYDMENWVLLDMSVMSVQAEYNRGLPLADSNAAGGVLADSAEETDTQPVRIGPDGKLYTAPGGYYTPTVSQPDANTMEVAYTPSSEDMPAVEPVQVALPAGPVGATGSVGPQGPAGTTPHIGDNGNWWIGETDTGKPSRGETGEQGPAGTDGKSAYQYAKDGGYTGTEAEFAAKLAAEKFANPNALTFTGAVTGSYDGSAPLSVEIPSGGGASGDYIPIPPSAEVGQTIVVKAVDEGGKPTEWEAVDMPGGSGRKETAVLADFELSEDITNYGAIVIPLAENPFEFSEILVMISAQLADDSRQYQGYICSSDGRIAQLFHLNDVFSKTETRNVVITSKIFANSVSSVAVKKGDYMWTTTSVYGYSYKHNTSDDKINALKITNSSALSGATFTVEGIK